MIVIIFQTASLDMPQTGLPDESLTKLLSDYPQITPAVHAKLTPEVSMYSNHSMLITCLVFNM